VHERARLKTSGAAHNLCDEHRYRQNEHQRKLDAKNRLHKRERRSAKGVKGDRFSPYQSASARRQSRQTPGDAAESSEAPPAAATTTTVEVEDETASVAQTPVLGTTGSGAMFLPNGPQPPQLTAQ
jgi:hypothetical protein